MREHSSFANIWEELESEEYKKEYDRHLKILNSFQYAIMFANMNCSRSVELKSKLFCLSVITDIHQSLVAIRILCKEGIRNACRRELRYLIELAIKASLISQHSSEMSNEEQIDQFRETLGSTNITMIKDINFYFFNDKQRDQFITDTKRTYGKLCLYVHATSHQMYERVKLDAIGCYIGYEGIEELHELNEEIGHVLSSVLILFFHAIPKWCVGDYFVERDGYTVDTYFTKFNFFSMIDMHFDYKCERQDKLDEIQEIRNSRICY